MLRRAFVIRLGLESQARQRQFVGSIEEADTGREAYFHSTDELLSFLAECCERAQREASMPDAGGIPDADDHRRG